MSSSLATPETIDTIDRFSDIPADGITKKRQKVELIQYHLTKMGCYKEQPQWTASVPFAAYVKDDEELTGRLADAPLYKGKRDNTRLDRTFLTSKTTGFQINLLAAANPWQYRPAPAVLHSGH